MILLLREVNLESILTFYMESTIFILDISINESMMIEGMDNQ